MAIEQGKPIEFHDIDTVYDAIFFSLPYRGFDNNGIDFEDCYSSKVNSTSAYTSVKNNLNCVPYKIYVVE